MLKRLNINNFKIHKHLDLSLRNLTVLSGYNSAGKSSVIQSLLLLRQNYAYQKVNMNNIDLNGTLCRLGFCKDVICYKAESDEVSLELFGDGGEYGKWRFDMGPSVSNKTYSSCNEICFERGMDYANLFTNNFQYLSISRVGPMESYPLDSKVVDQERQLSKDMGKGELTPHFLFHYSKESPIEVPEELCCATEERHDLLSQVSAWEGQISAGVSVHTKLIEKSFVLEYSYNDGLDVSPSFSAVNVGSGLSFVLPIITALLSTPKGGLVIVENPEAHLHPKGQAILSKLICAAAQYGIQVIIETHSDYILNGILISCQEFERSERESGVSKDNVAIYQFIKNEDTQLAEPVPVHLAAGGTISNQPEGFFEQMELDMNQLLSL